MATGIGLAAPIDHQICALQLIRVAGRYQRRTAAARVILVDRSHSVTPSRPPTAPSGKVASSRANAALRLPEAALVRVADRVNAVAYEATHLTATSVSYNLP
jgi:hypothetical protein